MGLWNVIGKVGKAVFDQVKETTNEAQSLKDKYQEYSDDRLKSIVKSGRTAEIMAASSVLKQRGYGSQS